MRLSALTLSSLTAAIATLVHLASAGPDLAPLATSTGPGTAAAVQAWIVDYKGNLLDLAYGSAGEYAPVQTLNNKGLGETAQEWIIAAVSGGGYTVQNNRSSTFLSYPVAGTSTSPDCAQLCGRQKAAAVAWNFVPAGSQQGFYFIKISQSGGPDLAITSWPRDSQAVGLTTPATLQIFNASAPEQVFGLYNPQ